MPKSGLFQVAVIIQCYFGNHADAVQTRYGVAILIFASLLFSYIYSSNLDEKKSTFVRMANELIRW